MKQPATIPPKHKVFLRVVLGPAIEEVSKTGEILYPRRNKVTLLPDGDGASVDAFVTITAIGMCPLVGVVQMRVTL